jgi:hypothetical protein
VGESELEAEKRKSLIPQRRAIYGGKETSEEIKEVKE